MRGKMNQTGCTQAGKQSRKGLMRRRASVQMLFNLYLNWAGAQIKNLLRQGRPAKARHPDKYKRLREENTQKKNTIKAT